MERIAGQIMLLWGPRRWALAFIAGALGAFSLPPFDFFAVLFVSFPILVWLLDGANGNADAGFLGKLKPAFWTGWWFGFGYFVGGLWWLANALLVGGGEFAWAIPLAVFGLPAILAMFYGLAAASARALWSDGLGRICALAAGFGLAEWLRSFVLTGFPWNAIGYGAMPVPVLMQSSAVIGLFGVSALAVFVFCVPALIATRRGFLPGLIIAATLLCAHIGYGVLRLMESDANTDGQPVIRLVQPSIDQSAKWDDAERERIFQTLLAITATPPLDNGTPPSIIVWPETSIPFLLTSNPNALAMIAETLQEGQTLIAGAVRDERHETGGATRYYNSIYVIDHNGQIIQAADKLHLVPFGEYLPLSGLLRSLGLDTIATGPGGFSAGSMRRTVPIEPGLQFLPLVCYEAIFPQDMVFEGPVPDFMINVTNDAWYGDTPGPPQHFRQAQLRSVETGLPLIRAANNGISAVTDGNGRIIDGLSQNVIGFADVSLPKKIHANRSAWLPQLTFWLIIALLLLGALNSRYSFIRTGN